MSILTPELKDDLVFDDFDFEFLLSFV